MALLGRSVVVLALVESIAMELVAAAAVAAAADIVLSEKP